MDESSKEALFATSLQAAAAATAGSSTGGRVVLQSSDSGERLAKIARLRLQIASGEYDPDAAAISKRLIDDHLAS